MSLPSFQTPSYGHGHNHGHNHAHGHSKITKSRSKTVVKPILKKLHSPHSEKNSLDLNRSWEEQTPAVTYSSLDYGSRDDDGSAVFFSPSYAVGDAASGSGRGSIGSGRPSGTRSTRDVSFTLSSTDLPGGSVAGASGSAGGRIKYSHTRSTSGASHISIATTGSGRNGSFVHPFAQTPRTSTPPLLSYANSLASLDNPSVGPRDYSPTITENGSDNKGVIDQHTYHTAMAAVTTATARSYHSPALPHPHSDPRRPSLASSQRTNSLSDVTQSLPPATTRSNSGLALRIAQSAVNQSRPDPQLGSASPATMTDSPLSTTAPIGSSPLMTASHSSSAVTTPMSPLRSSLDMSGFRLRSRSEVDTATRQEHVRLARRRFEEKEKAKEEKYAREQVRKRERADNREAQRQTQIRKASFGTPGLSSGRNSTSTDPRPSAAVSRKSTGTGRFDAAAASEKVDFATRGYDSVPMGDTPEAKADDVHFESQRRRKVTKRKTTGTWTAFVLWLRTRLLKMGRR